MYGIPQNTIVNRIVPKKTFIDQLGATSRMKEHFTRDVERILWLSKLSPSTLNVTDSEAVHEIAIFTVQIKGDECPNDIFVHIDNFLPRHTLFILERGSEVQLHINYKEWISGNTDKKFKITKSYRSGWMNADALSLRFESQSMDGIYESLVRQVAGERIVSTHSDLQTAIEQTAQKEALEKEIQSLERQIMSERQPNKRFALHKSLMELKGKI